MKYHPIRWIIICHSCENRNPGFPVKTGIQFLCMVPCFRRDKSGFPLEFIPIEIGAGMTFLEAALSIMDRKLDNFYTIYSL
jgi:hypothetical protein